MSRFKLIVLSMFAVLAVGAVASASASAEGCSDGGTKNLFCTFPGNVELHNLLISGESGLSLLSGIIGITSFRIHCKDDLFNATLQLLGLATGEIDFLGCTVEKPAGMGCKIGPTHPNLVLAIFHLQLASGVMAPTGLAIGTKSTGEEFSTLEIEGSSCIVKGSFAVTGTQTVEFPKGEEGLVEHEVVAKKAGSNLKVGGNEASFSSTAKVHLHSGEKWLIMLGT
jgi:hypothetical protein